MSEFKKTLEKHIDEAWLEWRKFHAKQNTPGQPTELEIWHRAYRDGMAFGEDLQREECASFVEKQPNDWRFKPWITANLIRQKDDL